MKYATCPVDNKSYLGLNMQLQSPDMPDGVKQDKRFIFPKKTAYTK